jgi:hypothetical protein
MCVIRKCNYFLFLSLSLPSIESNWGLPLAIAANLHTPYRIEIGIESIMKAKIEDKHGKGKDFEH